MRLNHRLHDGQAEARAGARIALLLRLRIAGKGAGQHLGRHALAAVRQSEIGPLAAAGERQVKKSAGGGKLDGVRQ